MSDFDAALGSGGPRVGAWDFEDNDRTRLDLYEVSDAGARLVAETRVGSDARENQVDQQGYA